MFAFHMNLRNLLFPARQSGSCRCSLEGPSRGRVANFQLSACLSTEQQQSFRTCRILFYHTPRCSLREMAEQFAVLASSTLIIPTLSTYTYSLTRSGGDDDEGEEEDHLYSSFYLATFLPLYIMEYLYSMLLKFIMFHLHNCLVVVAGWWAGGQRVNRTRR